MSEHRDPEHIEEEIEYTRERIDRTLADLEHQFSPGQLVDRALGYTRNHGTDFADNLVSTISNNPVPALLTGVGLAWLMASRGRSAPAEYRDATVYETGPSKSERAKAKARAAGEKVSSAGHKASDAASRAGDSIRSGARHAQETVSSAASSTRAAASRAGNSVRHGADAATDQLQQWHDQNPLVMGGIAFALGAALGAATPNTRREDELMGEHGEQLRERAATEARKQEAKVAEKASKAADKTREKVRKAGDKARSKQQKAQSKARSRVDQDDDSKTRTGSRSTAHSDPLAPGRTDGSRP